MTRRWNKRRQNVETFVSERKAINDDVSSINIVSLRCVTHDCAHNLLDACDASPPLLCSRRAQPARYELLPDYRDLERSAHVSVLHQKQATTGSSDVWMVGIGVASHNQYVHQHFAGGPHFRTLDELGGLVDFCLVDELHLWNLDLLGDLVELLLHDRC